MKQSLKVEISKALNNPMFWAALGIGMIICGINIAENRSDVQSITRLTLDYIEQTGMYSSFEGCSLFVKWVGVNGVSFGHRAFYFVWPILAAMPFGWSYCTERKSGVYDQFISRAGIRAYYIAKYIAVFVSGGLAVALPVLLNLLANALVCPSVTPSVQSSLVAIFDGDAFSKLFYTYPWLHGLLWCLIDFLWGGTAAGLCFLVGAKPRLHVLVTLTPFVLFMLLYGLYTVVQKIIGLMVELSPLNLAAAAGAYSNPEPAIFTVMGVLLFVSFFAGWRQVTCHELV